MVKGGADMLPETTTTQAVQEQELDTEQEIRIAQAMEGLADILADIMGK